MTAPRHRDTDQAGRLANDLTNAGVTLPERVHRGADHLTSLSDLIDDAFRRPLPDDLLDLDTETLQAVIRQQGIGVAVTRDAGTRGLSQQLRSALSNAVADALADCADDVIGQLADKMRADAEAVHNATIAGITPTTTAEQIVRGPNVAECAAAWATLPDHVAALQRTATLRLRLTAVTGVPPVTDMTTLPNGSHKRAIVEDEVRAACFTTHGQPWVNEHGETPAQRWLRLSQTAPVTLLSVAAAAQAWADAHRVTPRGPGPVTLDPADAHPRRTRADSTSATPAV